MPFIPPSFIKNVALEIDKSYSLSNSPFPSESDGKDQIPYIGRKQHIAKLLAFLFDPMQRGVFLVTGYRGMGKTSFVNHVLKQYKLAKEKKVGNGKVKTIHLTLAQNHPKEIDILRLIVMSVFDEYKTYISKGKWSVSAKFTIPYTKWSVYTDLTVRHILKLLFIPFLILLSPLVVWKSGGRDSFLSFSGSFITNLVTSPFYNNAIIAASIFLVSLFLWVSFKIYWLQHRNNAFNRIRWLVERCYTSLSEENSATDEAGVPIINIKLFRGEKRTKHYPIASTKEMEYELQIFLEKAFKQHNLEFIFIFDELDKLDTPVAGPYLYDEPVKAEGQKWESAYERELRERKQAIINIITGLKNFFTTAKARFIFIAGREMFDASLADISDRQSPISSIFTYVFNIESLLKEKDISNDHINSNHSSLSYGIEIYLKKLLFGAANDTDDAKTLFDLAKTQYIDQSTGTPADFNKLYFILQNFITYLTYRSNGSPKKLIKEIHEFIKVKSPDMDQCQTLIYRQPQNDVSTLYLYFSYDNQYRTGFINYIYRPFLIKHGRSFKLYSDNIIVSTPYLFDHLLKFHPFAFSMSNLELVPEVLSTNKTPSLREHIRQIIDYLSGSHIREIEIGLFDYKFNSRTLNEITFLSKIFEPEAAALNYTLDESHLVKLHVRNKIRDLRNTYARFLEGPSSGQQIASIAHLNGILGDLHFFDQEYDDAIVAYHDAIRPLEEEEMINMSMQDFITLLRNRLKAGLCFEKISAYEDALSSYSDTSDDSVRFMAYRLRPGIPGMDKEPYTIQPKNKVPDAASFLQFFSGPLSDLLQIVLQSFISQMHIQEKKSVAGISELKLCMSLGSFLNITGGFLANEKRNHVIKAQAFLQTGNLLYFKNSERRPDLKNYKVFFPKTYLDYLEKLLKWDAAYDHNHVKSAKPVMAFLFYIMGLNEIIAYREPGKIFIDRECHQKNIVSPLLETLQLSTEQGPKEEMLRGIYYNYAASLLSAMGDCILGTYIKGKSAHNFTIEEIFKPSSWEEQQENLSEINFDRYLLAEDKNKFQLQDVLRCYYLSGRYFLRQGRVSSCGFQYKKILYVLRLVLRKGCLDHYQLDVFFEMLQQSIIEPLLRFAGQNAGYGESHMKNKATKSGVDPDYADNNLSNHPETREVWLLYHYIRLKAGVKKIEGINYLISSNNSFATQYARIQELDFYAKYLRRNIGHDEAVKIEGIRETLTEQTNFSDSVSYLYSMLSILQIMDIYGSDYWLGYSYLAYTHLRIAKFLISLKNKEKQMDYIQIELSALIGTGSFASLDAYAHFAKAAECYGQAERLQHAGEEYKQTIADMICLEDDFNDSAYHFGAALDRYMMNNDLFKTHRTYCQEKLEQLRAEEA